MSWNYCPSCGEKLVDEAKFCHSCGRELEEQMSDYDVETTERQQKDEEEDAYKDFRFIDETTMDDIDVEDLSHSDGEYYEILEEAIEEEIENQDITINEIDADQLLTHIFVEKVMERSTRIKLEERNKQSMSVDTIQEEMDSENE